jgi:hypothetical protein
MEKSIAGLIAVVPLTVSLVVAGDVAHADPIPGDRVATTTTVMSPSKVTRGKSAKVCAEVTVKSGTGTPVGSVTFGVRRFGSATTTFTTVAYSGGQACITTAKLMRTGGRGVAATYSGNYGLDGEPLTVFVDSTGVGGFEVVKKRHHHHH